MSTDYEAATAVGILLKGEEEDATDIEKLRTHVPEKSHMEKNFDKRTGKRLPDEKVIDQDEQDMLVVDGTEYDDTVDGLEAIANKLGLNIIPHQSQYGGVIGYVIGLRLDEVKAETACAMIKRVKAKDKEIRKLFKLEATNHVKIYGCLWASC